MKLPITYVIITCVLTYLLKYVVTSYYWGTFVKFVLVDIDSISTNFAQYDFFQVPKIVLSGDPLYKLKPRMLVDVSARNTKTSILGKLRLALVERLDLDNF